MIYIFSLEDKNIFKNEGFIGLSWCYIKIWKVTLYYTYIIKNYREIYPWMVGVELLYKKNDLEPSKTYNLEVFYITYSWKSKKRH